MADRYQDRSFPADDGYDHGGDQRAPARTESDPLAELARLIGQADPFASAARPNPPVPPRNQYQPPAPHEDPPAGPPPWMQRAARQEAPARSYEDDAYAAEDHSEPDYPVSEHPLRRYAAQHAQPEPEPEYESEPHYAAADQPVDPARYDDALYGELVASGHDNPQDQAYQDDAYAYQDDYEESEEPVQKRRGGLTTVAVVLALAVVGTGAAFGYRTYVGSPRSGEPPIIKADTSPTKIVPAPADGSGKVPDRLAAGDGTEKIVPREEAPVDVNANTKAGPRMVFPPLNQNANPPSPASVAPNAPLPSANTANGTLANNQPRPIRTFTVRGDQADAGTPAAVVQPAAVPKPAHTATTPVRIASSAANANASSANAPLSLSPQATQSAPAPAAPTRVATSAPVPIAPSASSGSGYLVQVSSQKNEADAHASYRVLQGKYPSVLGSQSVLVKRVDLGEKGVYYRAFAGPFSSAEQATQVCSSLKAAGGPQCLIQRN
jgi:SPOR domain